MLSEAIAYECLNIMPGMTFSKMGKLFSGNGKSSSQVLQEIESPEFDLISIRLEVETLLAEKLQGSAIQVVSRKDRLFARKFNEMQHPIPLLYCKGNLGLLHSDKAISVVGTRNNTDNGEMRAKKLVKYLVENGYIIVSGLAKGIDTIALREAVKLGGKVVGVIGTPITEYYPKENKELQDLIAEQHLLVSHVPFCKYKKEHFKAKRLHFPERNSVMVALSGGTVVVEASETSGTRTQARAAINQGKNLYFLKSMHAKSTWAQNFVQKSKGKVLAEISDLLGDFMSKGMDDRKEHIKTNWQLKDMKDKPCNSMSGNIEQWKHYAEYHPGTDFSKDYDSSSINNFKKKQNVHEDQAYYRDETTKAIKEKIKEDFNKKDIIVVPSTTSKPQGSKNHNNRLHKITKDLPGYRNLIDIKREVESAHEKQGKRSPEPIYDNLKIHDEKVLEEVRDKFKRDGKLEINLIDDVITSGSSMGAQAKFLREKINPDGKDGLTIKAIALAQTNNNPDSE